MMKITRKRNIIYLFKEKLCLLKDRLYLTGFIKRLISSVVLIAFFVLAVFVFPGWIFALFLMFFCAAGTHEFFLLIEKKGVPTFKILGTLIATVIPVSVFIGVKFAGGWELFFIVLTIFMLFIIQFTRKNNTQAITTIALTLFGVFYVSWLLSFVIRIFLLERGGILVFYFILVTKMGDVFAYVFGSRFGKHSLISRISPHKTVEGAVFAFLGALLFSCLSKVYLPQVSFTHLVLLGVLLGGLGQLGDLSESLIKRDCQIKDSGLLIPGFGGVLDLLDSILFAAPAFYFYLIYIIK